MIFLKRTLARQRDEILFAVNHFRKGNRVAPFLMSAVDVNALIADRLLTDHPFAVARMGRTEARLVGEYLFRKSSYSRLTYKQSAFNAGIFPPAASTFDGYASVFVEALSDIDILGFWPSEYQLDILSRPGFASGKVLARHHDLEPFLVPLPWTSALAGKRVLLISNYGEIAQSQYLKRDSLHHNHLLLPQFQLACIEAPTCNAGQVSGFSCWRAAFEDLCSRADAQDCDVALMSAGSFSIPLAAFMRSCGKQAIHIGACIQLLFGLRGGRWDHQPGYEDLPTSSWTRLREIKNYAHQTAIDQGDYV